MFDLCGGLTTKREEFGMEGSERRCVGGPGSRWVVAYDTCESTGLNAGVTSTSIRVCEPSDG